MGNIARCHCWTESLNETHATCFLVFFVEFRGLVEETCRGGGLNAGLVADTLREAMEEAQADADTAQRGNNA